MPRCHSTGGSAPAESSDLICCWGHIQSCSWSVAGWPGPLAPLLWGWQQAHPGPQWPHSARLPEPFLREAGWASSLGHRLPSGGWRALSCCVGVVVLEVAAHRPVQLMCRFSPVRLLCPLLLPLSSPGLACPAPLPWLCPLLLFPLSPSLRPSICSAGLCLSPCLALPSILPAVPLSSPSPAPGMRCSRRPTEPPWPALAP